MDRPGVDLAELNGHVLAILHDQPALVTAGARGLRTGALRNPYTRWCPRGPRERGCTARRRALGRFWVSSHPRDTLRPREGRLCRSGRAPVLTDHHRAVVGRSVQLAQHCRRSTRQPVGLPAQVCHPVQGTPIHESCYRPRTVERFRVDLEDEVGHVHSEDDPPTGRAPFNLDHSVPLFVQLHRATPHLPGPLRVTGGMVSVVSGDGVGKVSDGVVPGQRWCRLKVSGGVGWCRQVVSGAKSDTTSDLRRHHWRHHLIDLPRRGSGRAPTGPVHGAIDRPSRSTLRPPGHARSARA